MKNKTNYTPPHDHEAEAGMLACVLTSPKAQAVMLLSKLDTSLWDDFRHSLIFLHLVELKREGKPLDAVALYQRIKDHKARLNEVTGDDVKCYIMQLPDRTPSPANWPTYFDTIVDRAWRRRVLSQLQALALDVCDTSQNVKAIAQKIKEISV